MCRQHDGTSASQRLRAEGQRMTAQCALLLRIIQRSGGHLDANDIYRQAGGRDPEVGLSTLCCTLNLPRELHLTTESHFDEEHLHYEMTADVLYREVVCAQCGRLVEFQSPSLTHFGAELEQPLGFAPERLQAGAVGQCRECRDRALGGEQPWHRGHIAAP